MLYTKYKKITGKLHLAWLLAVRWQSNVSDWQPSLGCTPSPSTGFVKNCNKLKLLCFDFPLWNIILFHLRKAGCCKTVHHVHVHCLQMDTFTSPFTTNMSTIDAHTLLAHLCTTLLTHCFSWNWWWWWWRLRLELSSPANKIFFLFNGAWPCRPLPAAQAQGRIDTGTLWPNFKLGSCQLCHILCCFTVYCVG